MYGLPGPVVVHKHPHHLLPGSASVALPLCSAHRGTGTGVKAIYTRRRSQEKPVAASSQSESSWVLVQFTLALAMLRLGETAT